MAKVVRDAVFVFNLDGERKQLSFIKLPCSVWAEVKRLFDFTQMSLVQGIVEGDVVAVGAFIWLERKQHERDLRWSTVQREMDQWNHDFDLLSAVIDGEVIFAEGEEEPEPEEEPDPTKAV
jgi:hypothetical protein